ncbi:hypothetical protein IT575_11350 [bacterium]|nr:hypothetical protein [bacterium]
MLERWLASYPELELLDLDIKPGRAQQRETARLFPLSRFMLSPSERALISCLELLASGDAVRASYIAYEQHRGGTLLPDLDLLAGCFMLADGQAAQALEPLAKVYRQILDEESPLPSPGLASRRLFPGLRILARVCPVLLLPLYPNEYAVGVLYAMALMHTDQHSAALEVLRELAKEFGLNDELKLLGGMCHLSREDVNAALSALSAPEHSQHDSVEYARCLYLAWASLKAGKVRSAIRELQPAVTLTADVNPHLHARAALLLAECYGQQGQALNALRVSGRVQVDEVPGYVAAEMLSREQEWLEKLSDLGSFELERLARSDGFSLEASVEEQTILVSHKLDVHRNPLDELRPTEMSWVKRREETAQIEQLKDAHARGLPLPKLKERSLSHEARELKLAILRAEQWWPGRREALSSAAARMRLAQESPLAVGHVRFDFCGERPAPHYWLQGERRAQLAASVAGAAVLIGIGLSVMRGLLY